MTRAYRPLAPLMVLLVSACGTPPALSEHEGFGANPTLPEARQQKIPLIKIAPAIGWSEGQTPVAAQGLRVQAFARDLAHPRWVYELPNGDVLVAESDAPPKPEDKRGGLKGWFQGLVMKRAGSQTPSANRITLLRDANRDGVAETRSILLENLTSPFGMAMVADRLFVANADAVVAFPYQSGQTKITSAGVKIADLPAGRNHHWTKSLIASPDGQRLYVGVGSNSNVGENSLEEEVDRAAILEITIATGAKRIFASGLRNPVGMDWNPEDGQLWVAVNERDEIGNDLVPDYMTSVVDGGFYGWPWSYYGPNVDERVKPARPDRVATAIKPDYALGSHTASLGLGFYRGDLFPQWKNGVLIGQHGSWNRNPPSGYKVIFIPFTGGKPSGAPRDVLTGFRNNRGQALGRPVGVIGIKTGAVLVADDAGNAIWHLSPQGASLTSDQPIRPPTH